MVPAQISCHIFSLLYPIYPIWYKVMHKFCFLFIFLLYPYHGQCCVQFQYQNPLHLSVGLSKPTENNVLLFILFYVFYLFQGIGLKERNVERKILLDLEQQVAEINAEKGFLQDGCKKAKETYESKRKQPNVGEQSLFALAWEVNEFEKLLKIQGDVQCTTVQSVKEMIQEARPRGNVPKKLTELWKLLVGYVQGIATRQREAASHLLVFMVSYEQRSSKPYAIPIRALPYRSITDDMVRGYGTRSEIQCMVLGCLL